MSDLEDYVNEHMENMEAARVMKELAEQIINLLLEYDAVLEEPLVLSLDGGYKITLRPSFIYPDEDEEE